MQQQHKQQYFTTTTDRYNLAKFTSRVRAALQPIAASQYAHPAQARASRVVKFRFYSRVLSAFRPISVLTSVLDNIFLLPCLWTPPARSICPPFGYVAFFVITSFKYAFRFRANDLFLSCAGYEGRWMALPSQSLLDFCSPQPTISWLRLHISESSGSTV